MSCESKTINLKTGSQVKLNCVYKDATGDIKSLAGVSINSDFISPKNGNLLVSTSTANGLIVITNELVGEYTIDAGVSTDWPLGEMPVDILYTKEGDPSHTEDFIIDFELGRTVPTAES